MAANASHASRRVAAIAAACALLVALSACGSPKAAPSSTAPPSATPVSAIKQAWTAFFSGTTSAKAKISLLENGASFSSVIDAQAASPLAKGASAKVKTVRVTSSSEATVVYTVLLDGQPALTNQTGNAVLQDGHWKVGSASFCGLLRLEGVHAPACSA